jgi:lipoyl(octanoyl) transferase
MSLDLLHLFAPRRRAGTFPLRVYLLGEVEFERVLALQQVLLRQVAADRDGACLIVCEHPPIITVGRQGGLDQIDIDLGELRHRGWRLRWVNRGGGCLLHLPGQFAIYPIVALDRLRLGLQDYLDRLHRILIAVLDDFTVSARRRLESPGVWVEGRMVAGVGVAVRDWVSYYGAFLNVAPELSAFRCIRTGRPEDGPMTSLVRERHGPLRPALVRERLLEHFCDAFDCERTALFFNHPMLDRVAAGNGCGLRQQPRTSIF